MARNHWLRDLRTLSCEHDLTDEPSRREQTTCNRVFLWVEIETAGKRSVGSWRGAATVWKQSVKLETARRRNKTSKQKMIKKIVPGMVTPSPVNSHRCRSRLHNLLRRLPGARSTSAHGHEKCNLYLILYTAWCSEIGSLTSLDACNSGASSNRREPISLHQAVQLQHSLTRFLRQYSIDYSLSSGFQVIGILVSALKKKQGVLLCAYKEQ